MVASTTCHTVSVKRPDSHDPQQHAAERLPRQLTQCTLLRRLATLPEDELQGDPGQHQYAVSRSLRTRPRPTRVRPAAPDLGNLLRLVNPDHNRVLPTEKHDHAPLRIAW